MDALVDWIFDLVERRWRLVVGLGIFVGPGCMLWRRAAHISGVWSLVLRVVLVVAFFYWIVLLRLVARRWPALSAFTKSGTSSKAPASSAQSSPNYLVRLGWDADGQAVVVDPRDKAGFLVTGIPGSGKTILVQLMLLQWIRQGAAAVFLDFKGAGDYAAFAAAGFQVIDDDIDVALLELRQAYQELQDRMEELRATPGGSNFWNRLPSQRRDLMVLVIDEVQELLETSGVSKERKELAQEAATLLRTLVKRGRAAGLVVILSTQKADATAIPTSIRDPIEVRISGAQKTAEASRMALGDIREGDPKPHQDIPSGAPGRMIVDGVAAHAVLFQADYLSDEQLWRELVKPRLETPAQSAERGGPASEGSA